MKKKLFAASISLTMAFIMMVSSSFAWYTINTQAEIEDVTVTMEGHKTIEIAVANNEQTTPQEVTANDGSNQEAFGQVVSYLGITNAALTVPATVDTEGKLKTVGYNETGRTGGLSELQATSIREGGYRLYTTGANGTGNKGAISYVAFIRTNTETEEGNGATITGTVTKAGTAAMSITVTDYGTDVGKALSEVNDPEVVVENADETFTFEAEVDHIYMVEMRFFYEGDEFYAAAADQDLETTASIVFTSDAITQ